MGWYGGAAKVYQISSTIYGGIQEQASQFARYQDLNKKHLSIMYKSNPTRKNSWKKYCILQSIIDGNGPYAKSSYA